MREVVKIAVPQGAEVADNGAPLLGRGTVKGKNTKSLRKAVRLYRKRRYSYVINLLEPQVFLFRENETYYSILGMSCLYTGDYAGAYSYLRRAADIAPDNVDNFLAIGVVLLRRRQIDVAIQNYLDLLDKDPKNRRAKRALQWIRTIDQPEEVLDWFESGKIDHILPSRGIYVPRSIVLAATLLIITSGAFFFGPRLLTIIGDLFPDRYDREGTELLEIDDAIARVSQEGSESSDLRLFELTEDEVNSLLREIIREFNNGRDNLVRREINRIRYSNAAYQIKEKARLLEAYLVEPDFVSMDDNFTYSEVESEPLLYDGVFVKWRGRIANQAVGDQSISFDLLVGYEDGRVLEGIVPVEVPFAVLIEEGSSVELIASVVPLGGNETPFALRVRDIRTLSNTEEE